MLSNHTTQASLPAVQADRHIIGRCTNHNMSLSSCLRTVHVSQTPSRCVRLVSTWAPDTRHTHLSSPPAPPAATVLAPLVVFLRLAIADRLNACASQASIMSAAATSIDSRFCVQRQPSVCSSQANKAHRCRRPDPISSPYLGPEPRSGHPPSATSVISLARHPGPGQCSNLQISVFFEISKFPNYSSLSPVPCLRARRLHLGYPLRHSDPSAAK